MKILKSSQAGSFESSDLMVLIEPVEENSGRKIEVDSTVMLQYGEDIQRIVVETLDIFEIFDIHLIVKDKGALDATLKARLETAITRAANLQKGTLI